MIPHHLIGQPHLATLEVEVEEPDNRRWLFGHFRLHAGGDTVGNWHDLVMLRGVIQWWRHFVDVSVNRWEESFEALEPAELFVLLRDGAYSRDVHLDVEDVDHRFNVNSLGMSAFDPYVVMLVEPPDNGQWLLWRREDGLDTVHVAQLPAGTLQAVGAEFVAKMDALYPFVPEPDRPRPPRT